MFFCHITTVTARKCLFILMIPVSGFGLRGKLRMKWRWTQMQLHTGGKDKGEQKASFIKLKLNAKNKCARYKNNPGQKAKVAKENSKTKYKSKAKFKSKRQKCKNQHPKNTYHGETGRT